MSRLILPASFVALLAFTAGVLSAPAPEPNREVRAIVDKAIEAKGGAEKLAKYKAIQYKLFVNILTEGVEGTFTGSGFEQAPDKSKLDVTLRTGEVSVTLVRVIDGDKGHEVLNGATQVMGADELSHMRDEMYVNEIVELRRIKAQGLELTLAGQATIEGRPAVIVKVSSRGHSDIKLYFDKANSLLLKAEDLTREPGSKTPIKREITYSNYKSVSGLMLPFNESIYHDGKLVYKFEKSDISVSDKLPDGTFAKP